MTQNMGTKINNAIDGSGRAVGRTIDTRADSVAPYKTYEGTIAADVDIDACTDLGRFGSAGYVANDDTGSDSIGVKLSVNGTTFGDAITVKAGEVLNLDVGILFKAVKLVYSASAPYRVVIR